MTRSFILTPDARKDVTAILRYTRRKWGDKHVRRYGQLLENCFQEISNGSVVSKTPFPQYVDMQMHRCEHHYVFYTRLKSDSSPTILAVLHKNMDMLNRLQDRL